MNALSGPAPDEETILKLERSEQISPELLWRIQKEICKKHKVSFISKDALVKIYRKMVASGKIKLNREIESVLRLKQTRSHSGIVVVSVLTKPFACPGNCLYCPTEKNVPKSYLSNEPAVMRAIACNYNPYTQTISRLKALAATGHPVSKINIRIIGGTWSFYPKQYQSWFTRQLFAGCNDFAQNKSTKADSLERLQKTNETANCRVVELSVETRQDYINQNEIARLRRLGVTKVELGVQSIYDKVLRFNKRGHGTDKTIEATRLLRDAGFKIAYQVMPNLAGSSFISDVKMFRELFHNSSYKPDYLKIYPLAVLPNTQLFHLYQSGQFKPYSKEELIKLLIKIKSKIPRYCRIERVIRDIPSQNIIDGGAKISNLRQIVNNEMTRQNLKCQCIRCHEIHGDYDNTIAPKLFRHDYDAGDGKEIFLSLETPDRSTLFSLLRLRIPSYYFCKTEHWLPALNNSALIREIHTYGRQIAVDDSNASAAQHRGFGKILMIEAERITKEEFGLSKLAVISGIGVREYFSRLGFALADTYMIKEL